MPTADYISLDFVTNFKTRLIDNYDFSIHTYTVLAIFLDFSVWVLVINTVVLIKFLFDNMLDRFSI